MEELLDVIDENENKPDKVFSRLSFVMAVFTTGLLLYFNHLIPTDVKTEGFPVVSPAIIWLARLSGPLGFVFSVISFVKKEPRSVLKWIGASVNTIIFALYVIVLVMIYSKVNLY